jgi:hypothetical protein
MKKSAKVLLSLPCKALGSNVKSSIVEERILSIFFVSSIVEEQIHSIFLAPSIVMG